MPYIPHSVCISSRVLDPGGDVWHFVIWALCIRAPSSYVRLVSFLHVIHLASFLVQTLVQYAIFASSRGSGDQLATLHLHTSECPPRYSIPQATSSQRTFSSFFSFDAQIPVDLHRFFFELFHFPTKANPSPRPSNTDISTNEQTLS